MSDQLGYSDHDNNNNKAYVKIITIRSFYRLSLEVGKIAIIMIKPCLIPTVPKESMSTSIYSCKNEIRM